MSKVKDALNDYDMILAFATVLTDVGFFSSASDVIDYFEKPHNWINEYVVWIKYGQPTYDDENWDEFVKQVTNI